MSKDATTLQRFIGLLLEGDRPGARALIESARAAAREPQELVPTLLWPAYQKVEAMYRADGLTRLQHHCATRLLRVLVDQVSAGFERAEPIGQSVLACCGPSDADELGAQIAVDMLEAAGYSVVFAGGGIAGDEILARVQTSKPELLVLFASAPSDLPEIRELIDQIAENGAHPSLRVVVGGGVFSRAEGLADEIGADGMVDDPLELVELVTMGVPKADRPSRGGRPQKQRLERV